jgi:hypothetical protein
MVAVEIEGQCFGIAMLYNWGVTTSIVTRTATDTLGLHPTRHHLTTIQGLGGKMTQSKVTYAVPLVARNSDIKMVFAWEVGDIASLPGGNPPRRCRRAERPIKLLIGLDHSNLMPEHAAESTRFTSQLRLMMWMFGNQHILVGTQAFVV